VHLGPWSESGSLKALLCHWMVVVTVLKIRQYGPVQHAGTSLLKNGKFCTGTSKLVLHDWDGKCLILVQILCLLNIQFRKLHPQTFNRGCVPGYYYGMAPDILVSHSSIQGGSVAKWLACWTQAQKARVQIAAATLSSNSLRQTVHTHCASVHQAAKLVATLLRVARGPASLAESNGSLLPG